MLKYKILTIIIFCCIFSNAYDYAESLYDDIDVTNLTPENFQKRVIDDNEFNKVWIVVFYAPWCFFSQALVPEYIKAARRLRGVVDFGAVNVDKYTSLGQMYGIPGLPYIKIFGKNKERPANYLGPRYAKYLIRAAWSAELNNWFDA